MKPKPTFLLVTLLAGQCFAWHTRPHQQITRAAVLSLPVNMQRVWGDYKRDLMNSYCMLPDRYRRYHLDGDERWKPLRVYCETPGGIRVHNITWNRANDLAAIEYTLNGIIAAVRRGNAESAARYAGVLAHLLEDSTSPAHALMPKDSGQTLEDLVRAPPGGESIRMHRAIEVVAPDFDLGERIVGDRLVREAVRQKQQNLGPLHEVGRQRLGAGDLFEFGSLPRGQNQWLSLKGHAIKTFALCIKLLQDSLLVSVQQSS